MSDRLDEGTGAWPLRPWIMAAICAAAGLIFHFLVDPPYDEPLAPLRQAGATFVVVATLSFVVTVEKRRWLWAVGFALGWGAVIAFVGWFTARYNLKPTIFEWPYWSGLLAVLIAAPLFQTIRDEGRWSLPYGRLHGHAWADAVLGAAGLAFTAIVFLLAFLIGGLFDLIGIEAIKKLLEKGWFGWMLAGFAFGAAVGLLRERDRLLPLLQRLLRIVLSVLAPPLAVALVLFLASIPFTGLEKFWKSGIPATPLLLLAGANAILLSNTIFAEDAENRSDNPLLRWASLLLVAVVLPLAGIAALSMGERVREYGWTPERMWGVITIAVAISFGAAGWYAIWRGRLNFDEPLRPLQTAMAIGLCGIALLLALPILDFGAISANSQLARLESGKVSASQFDWAAMAFDFGPSGRAKLQNIAQSGAPEVRAMAAAALNVKDRWDLRQDNLAAGPPPVELTVFPKDAAVPTDLKQFLLHGAKDEDAFCSNGGACRVYPQPDGATFIVVMDGCVNLSPAQRSDPKLACTRTPGIFAKKNGKWSNAYESIYAAQETFNGKDAAALKQESDALDRGDVKVVPVERRQLAIGGQPKGTDF